MSDTINILHLSDLHFGAEPTVTVISTALAMRKITLNPLLETLNTIEPEWKPEIIVVSGDIGWCGAQKDYVEAMVWLKELLQILVLTGDVHPVTLRGKLLNNKCYRKNVPA